jgi:hypothetical protein
MKRQLFREDALQRAPSPERLDELVVLTSRRSWLAPISLCAFLIAVLLWSAFGSLPRTLTAQGILVREDAGPQFLLALPSANAGEISSGATVRLAPVADGDRGTRPVQAIVRSVRDLGVGADGTLQVGVLLELPPASEAGVLPRRADSAAASSFDEAVTGAAGATVYSASFRTGSFHPLAELFPFLRHADGR